MGPESRPGPSQSLSGSLKDPPKSISPNRQFEFISIQNPEEAKDRDKRRQARSHAVKQSLQSRRLQHQRPRNTWQPTPTQPEPVAPMKRTPSALTTLYSPSAGIPDPFGTLAVDSSRLRQLFDQPAARKAIEPVFTIEDEAVFQTFRSVFRTGLDDPALLNAVMLALTFQANGGTIRPDYFHYKGQAMHYIRERMNVPIQTPTEPILGAILLMAGVEARLGMRSQVQIHMKGIQQLLKASASARVHLTDGIKRAIFWQDLNASLMTGSERVIDHTTFAELAWKRDPFSPLLFELPEGFQRLSHLFTDEFIELVKDINALQCICNSPTFVEDAVSLIHIDNHQAWIESRLWALTTGSPFQECCNFAVYLSVNMLCCKVWRTSAIPTYLSAQILRLLKQTIDWREWDDHLDLLLWVLYMAGSVARDEVMRSEYIVLLQTKLAARYNGLGFTWPQLAKTMEQFIWSDQRFGTTVRAFWAEVQAILIS